MNIIFALGALLIISFLLKELGSKIKIPSIVMLLFFGIVLTIPGLKEVFIGEHEELISILGQLGLFSLMFLAGLESSWKQLQKEEKDSLILAFSSFFISFILGFLISFFILNLTFVAALIIGICMSITAEATTAKLLLEFGKLKTKLGSTMIGTGMVDDMLGLFFFSVVLFFLGQFELKEHLILLGIIFSFLAGIMTQKFAKHHHLTHKTQQALTYYIIPFFFISMGIHFNIFSQEFSWNLVIIITFTAILGKLLGSFLVKHYIPFSYSQLHILGWAMNSRGAVGLALALVAFTSGIISQELYSTLVIMTVLTTVVFPFVLEYLLKKNPRIMN